uniref:NADH dehydrogenase subunit 6 n=1 Tax=Pedicinus obtusus TaxID=592408 RepID=A0A7L9CWI3_9NEOP|nr:NADH dehydrogenase subunit 6 [Pedicinus obtusus]
MLEVLILLNFIFILTSWVSVKDFEKLICLILFVLVSSMNIFIKTTNVWASLMLSVGVVGGLMVMFSIVVMTLPKPSAKVDWTLNRSFSDAAIAVVVLIETAVMILSESKLFGSASTSDLAGNVVGFSALPQSSILGAMCQHSWIVIFLLLVLLSMLLVVEAFSSPSSRAVSAN